MYHIFTWLFLATAVSLQGLILEDLIASGTLREMLTNKRVGYYTGSFDPVHAGHEGFARGAISSGACDYVLVIPAWGGDSFKQRAPVEARLEFLRALFAKDPHIIVTALSPKDVQMALTKEVPGEMIRGYSVVKAFDDSIEFIGLVGSDTALDLGLPADTDQADADRRKRLQVFMKGVSIPEKYAESTIGSIMCLPVDQFIVSLRDNDDLKDLSGMIGDRKIGAIYKNDLLSDVSSTKIKERLRKGDSLEGLIDATVLEMVQKYKLYQAAPANIGFAELVTQIEKQLAKKPHAVVGISGFGGAGKSHLADQLRDHFKISDKQIVRIDHLYGPNHNGPGIFDQSDWPLLARILEDVHAGERLQYQGRNDKGESVHRDEALPKVVIVEGIRLLQPHLMPSFDISVWIDCPQELALKRTKARDRAQGDDEQTVSRWDTDWGPKDKKYYDTYRPNQLATFVYNNRGPITAPIIRWSRTSLWLDNPQRGHLETGRLIVSKGFGQGWPYLAQ